MKRLFSTLVMTIALAFGSVAFAVAGDTVKQADKAAQAKTDIRGSTPIGVASEISTDYQIYVAVQATKGVSAISAPEIALADRIKISTSKRMLTLGKISRYESRARDPELDAVPKTGYIGFAEPYFARRE